MQSTVMDCDLSVVSYPREALLLERERLASGEESAGSAFSLWRTAARSELRLFDKKSCARVRPRPHNKASRAAEGWKVVAVDHVPKPLSRSSSCSTIELDDDVHDEDECVEVSDEECVEVSDGASSDSFCHFSADSDAGDDPSHCARGKALNPQASEFLPLAPAPGLTLDSEETKPLIVSEFIPRADAAEFVPGGAADEFVPRADAAEFVPMAGVHEFAQSAEGSAFSFSADAKEFTPISICQAKEPSSHAHLPQPMKVTWTNATVEREVSSFVEPSKPEFGRANSAKISVHELQRLFAATDLTGACGSQAPFPASAMVA